MKLESRTSGRQLQDYFTSSDEIRLLMVSLLGNTTGKSVLEPCAGGGAFLRDLLGKPSRIDAVEIHEPYAIGLRNEFPNANIVQGDFLRFFVGDLFGRRNSLQNDYDAVICNPPYGLKLSLSFRREIKKAYPSLYARESYGLFLHFSLSLLRPNGRYVFIMPDTFLTSRNHRSLRSALLERFAPTHLIQFKSRRFGSVDFGYGNLCVLAGNKRAMKLADDIRWIDATSTEERLERLNPETPIKGRYFFENREAGWVHPTNQTVLKDFAGETKTLGELSECRTGIYTGNNPAFLGFDQTIKPHPLNGHSISFETQLVRRKLSNSEKITGISGKAARYVPFVRGGHRDPLAKTNWAIRWDSEAVEHYRSDRRARLQNLSFYFRKGLAVPMVTSGRLSASKIADAVFDQGVVGVFPTREDYIPYLLVFLNSTQATKLKQALFPLANNSANYLKRLPIPIPSAEQLEMANEIVDRATIEGWDSTANEREAFVSSLLLAATSASTKLGLKGESASPFETLSKDPSRNRQHAGVSISSTNQLIRQSSDTHHHRRKHSIAPAS